MLRLLEHIMKSLAGVADFIQNVKAAKGVPEQQPETRKQNFWTVEELRDHLKAAIDRGTVDTAPTQLMDISHIHALLTEVQLRRAGMWKSSADSESRPSLSDSARRAIFYAKYEATQQAAQEVTIGHLQRGIDRETKE